MENSIKYLGLREKVKQSDGSEKPMHAVTFFLVTDSAYADDGLCSLWIDAKTKTLEFIVTPHTIEHKKRNTDLQQG